MKHLRDQDLQAYLDNDPTLQRSDIEKHLRSCQQCRTQLATYKQVYSGLQDEEGFMLSANFAESVISHIEHKDERKSNLGEIGLLLVAIITGIGTAIYYSSIGSVFLEIFEKNTSALGSALGSISILSNVSTYVIVFAIVILTAFGFLDKLLLNVRHR